ncbi:MAG TPA: nuclear transport factor 2 family protein [Candidatus Polarisedimenticolia bacterium]|jgi:hypothetical protein|nr:nuclear transport factor 2 family protein [Candidatus Polarisedimenticolia bacterium]
MSSDNPIQVVLKFEALINEHNADAIVALMTGDAEFIDSLGNSLRGAEKLRSAWAGYFKMVPDYSISHSEILPMETRLQFLVPRKERSQKTASSRRRISGRLQQPGVP